MQGETRFGIGDDLAIVRTAWCGEMALYSSLYTSWQLSHLTLLRQSLNQLRSRAQSRHVTETDRQTDQRRLYTPTTRR